VSQPYNHINTGNSQGVGFGQIAFDFNMQQLQVHDGYGWKALTQDVTLSTNPMLNDTVIWAMKKMQEERDMVTKMEKFPALKKAHDNLELIKHLVNNYVEPEEDKTAT
jgi:hypothetical protein